MSIDGFVARQNARLTELYKLIAEQIKKDGGKEIHKNLRKLTEERDAIKNAVFLATRRGIGSEFQMKAE